MERPGPEPQVLLAPLLQALEEQPLARAIPPPETPRAVAVYSRRSFQFSSILPP
jgi:hypothetical protein